MYVYIYIYIYIPYNEQTLPKKNQPSLALTTSRKAKFKSFKMAVKSACFDFQ